MDKTTMAFIGLLAVLFLGQLILNEGFYVDASGSRDVSGSVTLSISDLLALIGTSGRVITSGTPPSLPGAAPNRLPLAPATEIVDLNGNAVYTQGLRDEIKHDIKTAVRSALLKSELMNNSNETIDDSCIDSISSQQGADFMKYIPGKNPDDYIRKDSIPCYGCSLPTN
jgi:hypothetical protein